MCKDAGFSKGVQNCQKAKLLVQQLNNIKKPKNQSKALLGLALHVLQDYYAHTVKLKVYLAYDGFRKTKDYLREKSITTTEFSHKYARSNNDFEDNTSEIPWRYKRANQVTKDIFSFYSKNKKIKNIQKKNVSKTKVNYFYSPVKYQQYALLSREFSLILK